MYFPYANSLLQQASSAEKPDSQNSLWNGHQCYTLKMWVQHPTLVVPDWMLESTCDLAGYVFKGSSKTEFLSSY